MLLFRESHVTTCHRSSTLAIVLTIIMSSKRPPKTNHPLHLSRAPSPSSIEMDSSFNNPTRWAIELFSLTFHWDNLVLLSISPLNMVPVVDAPMAFATEAHTPPPGPPISVPVPKQLDSACDQGLETSPTVSDHVMLTIVVANYWLISICLWPRRIRSNRYRSTQMRMSCLSSSLHHWLMLKYPNSECYCITSESGRQFRQRLISKLFSI